MNYFHPTTLEEGCVDDRKYYSCKVIDGMEVKHFCPDEPVSSKEFGELKQTQYRNLEREKLGEVDYYMRKWDRENNAKLDDKKEIILLKTDAPEVQKEKLQKAKAEEAGLPPLEHHPRDASFDVIWENYQKYVKSKEAPKSSKREKPVMYKKVLNIYMDVGSLPSPKAEEFVEQQKVNMQEFIELIPKEIAVFFWPTRGGEDRMEVIDL